MLIQRGFRDKLDKYLNTNADFEIHMDTIGGFVFDYTCFGVDSAGKLSDDRYMVFYNQTSSPENEISYSASGAGAKYIVNLSRLPMTINKLVFTVSIDGNGTMGAISNHTVSIKQNGNSVIDMQLNGSNFHNEKAIISIEIYRKDVWRIAAVASGFNGGLSDLLREFGGEEISSSGSQSQGGITPVISNQPIKSNKPVELKKGQKVNLEKHASTNEILINLNWSQPSYGQGIDLDLGCLYELKDGSKGVVQALENRFGSLDYPPYVSLDGDDRSGANNSGENLRINGKMIPLIKRILVFTYIYEGAANWYGTQGIVTVKCPGGQDIIVRLDEYGSNDVFCAIAMLENYNNETLSVEKLVRFFRNHEACDRAFGWGMTWHVAYKD